MFGSSTQRLALVESIAKSDVLERVAGSVAIHLYEMELRPDGTYECTAFIGAGLERLLGPLPAERSPEEAWEAAVHPEDRAAYDAAYDSLQHGRPVEIEYRLVGYDGQTRWVWDRMQPRLGDDGTVLVDGIVADVSERHRTAQELADLQRRLAHLAYHDSLTDLPNRVYFQEQLGLALARAADRNLLVGAVFVDLDDFKAVNDVFGHVVGDELLGAVAERLRCATRSSDFVARHGGDEFVVLVSDLSAGRVRAETPRADVETVAARIRELFRLPFPLSKDVEVAVSASVGTALFPLDADGAQSLLIAADRAMYAEKRTKSGAGASSRAQA